MRTTNPGPSSPFAILGFLWRQLELQSMQADSYDEMSEEHLGQLLYVDDYSSLTPQAQEFIDQEQRKLDSGLFSISLVNNVIGQSLIIATDRIIKSLSQDVNNAKKGPPVSPPSILSDVGSSQIFWAYGVRCAANYVRHAGEWKSEAVTFESITGNPPVISDFQRRDTQNNLQALSEILNCDAHALVSRDCTHAIAKRLDLTKKDALSSLFTLWKQARNQSNGDA